MIFGNILAGRWLNYDFYISNIIMKKHLLMHVFMAMQGNTNEMLNNYLLINFAEKFHLPHFTFF